MAEETLDLIYCDADWFQVQATEGMEMAINLVFTHALGDLDVTLYDQEGVSLAAARSGDDNEEVIDCIVELFRTRAI